MAFDGPFGVRNHARPLIWSVVRAVDSYAIHAVLHELSDQRVVVSRFAGHCHHDGDIAASRARPEGSFGVEVQYALTFRKIDLLVARFTGSDRTPGQSIEETRAPH